MDTSHCTVGVGDAGGGGVEAGRAARRRRSHRWDWWSPPGRVVTVRVAAVVVAVPAELVKTASYRSPFSPAVAVNE